MEIKNYPEVIKHLRDDKRNVNLLMGNGFSMAYDHNIFSYNALSTFITQTKDSELLKIFEIIKTKNFEQIMQELDLFKNILNEFDPTSSVIERLSRVSVKLQDSLIDAVKEYHPEYVFSVPPEKSKTCANFLEEFIQNKGKIFTTNYDLLLYWVLMRNNIPNCIDGFGRDLENDDGGFIPEEDREYSELRWGKYRSSQNIFYLHGALPLFDTGSEVIKEEYDGNYLLDKIKARMAKGNYPVFVTAGNGEEKLKHINHNHYLSSCYDKLSTITGSLITFGFNFGEYDEHIIHAINLASKQDMSNRLWSVYIGVYSEDDIKHIEQIQKKFKCKKLCIFDAKTANVWG